MRLLFTILLVFIAAITRAAVPTFQSFEPTQFETNNFRVAYKAVHTNDNGIIYPAMTNSLSLVTNENVYGTFSLPAKVTILMLGTNYLDLSTNSTWLLNSPTNDAAQVIISLSAGQYQGQLAFITSQNGGNSFTLPDLSEQWDVPGAYVDIQGDWIGTTNRGIILQYVAPDWVEMARFDPSNTGGGFPPLWASAGGFLYPNPAVTSLTVPGVISTNGYYAGRAVSWWGPMGPGAEAFVIGHWDEASGDSANKFMSMSVTDAGGITYNIDWNIYGDHSTADPIIVGADINGYPGAGSSGIQTLLTLNTNRQYWEFISPQYDGSFWQVYGNPNTLSSMIGATMDIGSLAMDFLNGLLWINKTGLTNGWVAFQNAGGGTNYIVEQLGPFTPGYIPYATGTNTLGDSPIYRASSTNIVVFGTFSLGALGNTNTFFLTTNKTTRLNQNDSSGYSLIEFANTNNSTVSTMGSGPSGFYISTTGILGTMGWSTNSLTFNPNLIQPSSAGVIDLGSTGSGFASLYLAGGVTTGDPGGGAAPWKLGTESVISTVTNLTVNVNGVKYSIVATPR